MSVGPQITDTDVRGGPIEHLHVEDRNLRALTARQVHLARMWLIYLVVGPFVAMGVVLFTVALFGTLPDDRLTLIASVTIAPFSGLAGAIIAFYFKTA